MSAACTLPTPPRPATSRRKHPPSMTCQCPGYDLPRHRHLQYPTPPPFLLAPCPLGFSAPFAPRSPARLSLSLLFLAHPAALPSLSFLSSPCPVIFMLLPVPSPFHYNLHPPILPTSSPPTFPPTPSVPSTVAVTVIGINLRQARKLVRSSSSSRALAPIRHVYTSHAPSHPDLSPLSSPCSSLVWRLPRAGPSVSARFVYFEFTTHVCNQALSLK
ncbi:hypothetical protein R3P38DRAFT_3202096 [Favolaschia claudopus]|uniref:Uncharacterized protein n=1 Tax=Favolaschia claudopus TaxID=2862362 RepID=A0AAW0AVC5_9AGAR